MTAPLFAFGLGTGTRGTRGNWLEVFYPAPLRDADAAIAPRSRSRPDNWRRSPRRSRPQATRRKPRSRRSSPAAAALP